MPLIDLPTNQGIATVGTVGQSGLDKVVADAMKSPGLQGLIANMPTGANLLSLVSSTIQQQSLNTFCKEHEYCKTNSCVDKWNENCMPKIDCPFVNVKANCDALGQKDCDALKLKLRC